MRRTLWHILPLDNEAKRDSRRDKTGGSNPLSDQKHLAERANGCKKPMIQPQGLPYNFKVHHDTNRNLCIFKALGLG
jgi:hypothetical protein